MRKNVESKTQLGETFSLPLPVIVTVYLLFYCCFVFKFIFFKTFITLLYHIYTI